MISTSQSGIVVLTLPVRSELRDAASERHPARSRPREPAATPPSCAALPGLLAQSGGCVCRAGPVRLPLWSETRAAESLVLEAITQNRAWRRIDGVDEALVVTASPNVRVFKKYPSCVVRFRGQVERPGLTSTVYSWRPIPYCGGEIQAI